MIIENQMLNYRHDRMSLLQSQDVAAYYAPRRMRPVKPVDQPCIKPVSQIEGSRFDVRG